MEKQRLKQNLINEVLNEYKKFIYVDPTTFKGLLDHEKSELVDYSYTEGKSQKSNSFFVYTNHVIAPQFADKFIEFDEKTAEIIKHLEWTYFDIIYPEKFEVSFNRKLGILKIGEKKLKFDPDKEPAKICTLLFGSKQYLRRVRQWDIIVKKVLDISKDRNQVSAMKSKVYRLNKRIYKKFGYINLIIFESKTLFVNPDYYYLFN